MWEEWGMGENNHPKFIVLFLDFKSSSNGYDGVFIKLNLIKLWGGIQLYFTYTL